MNRIPSSTCRGLVFRTVLRPIEAIVSNRSVATDVLRIEQVNVFRKRQIEVTPKKREGE